MSHGERLYELLKTALGPAIAELLKDPIVTEVRLNSDGTVWASRLGEGKRPIDAIVSADNARRAIYAVAYSVNEVCNDCHPSISAELPGTGERFQGVLPPLSKQPTFVIRKKAVRVFTLDDFEAQGILPANGKQALEHCVRTRQNILVAGGTDSGKTTFANALLQVVAQTGDRTVIIEDTQELQCKAPDVEYLRTKDGVSSLRDLVRVTMRLSPDRIVIGEVRGAEALELLKAWNTGHAGGVSTVHASSARQGLSRIEQLVQEAGVTPSRAMISEAVNVLVYMEKVGTKRIVRELLSVKGVEVDNYRLESLV